MRTRYATGLLVALAVIAGGVLAFVRTRTSQNPPGMHSLASFVSEKDYPTLANILRRSEFVGTVRILQMKRRGSFAGVDEKTKKIILDEKDKNLTGDEVLLRNEDIRRENLMTEYEAEVVSVMAGSFKPGDRFTLRIHGYAPREPKGIAKNASSSNPMEVTGDEYIYILVRTVDGIFAPAFRMKQDGDKLMQTSYGRGEMQDYDGSIVTPEILAQKINDNFGKPWLVDPTSTPLPLTQYEGLPTAAPAQPVDDQAK